GHVLGRPAQVRRAERADELGRQRVDRPRRLIELQREVGLAELGVVDGAEVEVYLVVAGVGVERLAVRVRGVGVTAGARVGVAEFVEGVDLARAPRARALERQPSGR